MPSDWREAEGNVTQAQLTTDLCDTVSPVSGSTPRRSGGVKDTHILKCRAKGHDAGGAFSADSIARVCCGRERRTPPGRRSRLKTWFWLTTYRHAPDCGRSATAPGRSTWNCGRPGGTGRECTFPAPLSAVFMPADSGSRGARMICPGLFGMQADEFTYASCHLHNDSSHDLVQSTNKVCG